MTHPHALPHGPLSRCAVHLCLDMQNLLTEGGPWQTPWMGRVLPVVLAIARRHPERTIFTRFMPPYRPEEMPGRWRAYFERWRELTREGVDPRLLELIPPLAELVPPAMVLDKGFYSAFHESRLAALLDERGADTLVISGAETDICVVASVFAAVDRGYRVVLARDALCSSADETHDASLAVYRSRLSLQIEVAETATILANWPM